MIFLKVFCLSFVGFSLVLAGSMDLAAAPAFEKPKVLRIGTSKEGTRGFTFGLALQKVASPYLEKEGTRVLSLATAGSEASVVLSSKGEAEIAWDSAFDLNQLATGTGIWEKRKIPLDKQPQLGFFSTYSLKYYASKAEIRSKITRLADMINYRMAISPPGTSYYPVEVETLKALGVYEKAKKNMKFIEPSRTAEAMATGEADICSPYGGVGTEALPSWAIEVDRRIKIKYIAPTPEEQKMLDKIPAYPFGMAPLNKKVWSQDIGADTVMGNISSYGMHFRPNIDPEIVYKFMKVIYEHWNEVLAITTLCDSFGPGEKPKEVNVKLISSFVGTSLRLHPGAAKFYKEVNWWQESWNKLLP